MIATASAAEAARHRALPALVGLAGLFASLMLTKEAPAQDLESKLHRKQAHLAHTRSRAGVLSTTIERRGDRLDQLRNQVASLRNREASVQAQLSRTEAELAQAKRELAILRAKLRRSLKVLRTRLVAIYESGQPDTMTVLLSARGFNALLYRADYLRHVQAQDTAIVERVRTLRNRTKDTVVRVRATRNEIAARKAELERTQEGLQARQSDLTAARRGDRQTLSKVQSTKHQLEGDVSDIQTQIQAQLRAAQAAQITPAQPAGPVQSESSSGFIWPVNGRVTSPFCEPRPWEACHPGIDISVPSGTPIRAAAAGTVVIAGPESGYGNYTCIDHGGGISSCYGHQETIQVSVGQHVSQGQVIGLSDCTGLCFGPHLHFEVRVDGQVTDPMDYLP